MKTKIVTIAIPSDFATMGELIAYVSKKLQKEVDNIPDFPIVNGFKVVNLAKASRKFVSYEIRYGQVRTIEEDIDE